MDTNQFTEQMKAFVSNWQKRLEEMQIQFSLGKMDATEAFETQKNHLRTLVQTMKENLDKGTDVAEEKLTEMRTKLEELRLQLALGKADGMDAFEEQRKKIELALHEFYYAGKQQANEAYNRNLELFDQNATAFKTGLEIVKLQFALAKMDARDEAAEKQKEIHQKMQELNQQFKTIQQTAMNSMDDMNKQLRESFEKMRVYAEGWMKK